MLKIGLVHTTVNSLEPSRKAFAALSEDIGEKIEIFNFLNEGLMPELRSRGATPRVRREVLEMVWNAESAGAEGIMLNCSLMSPYVEELEKFSSLPLIGADNAMLEYVAGKAGKVGIVATVAKAGPTTKKLLLEQAERMQRSIEAEARIAEGAFEALSAGDEARHNSLIQEAAKDFEGRVDMIVFAQISMVRALQGFSLATEIVTSPAISARKIVELAKRRREDDGRSA